MQVMTMPKQIKITVDEIVAKSSRKDQKQRIIEWNKVCQKLVENRSNLTVTLCAKHMLNNGFQITPRTVWNGDNPYKTIFNLWSDFLISVKAKASESKVNSIKTDDVFINDADLNAIDDPVLKYQVSLLYGQLKAYKQQVDMLNDVRNQQSISVKVANVQNLSLEDASKVILDEYELDLIKELLESPSVKFDKNGKMLAATNLRMGTPISAEGFKQALEKVLRSYNEKE